MINNNQYTFHYNVESENDYLGRYDLQLLMQAEIHPMCAGISPLVNVRLMENDIASVARVKNMLRVMHQCQIIAAEYFASGNQQEFNITELPIDHLAQLFPNALS